MTKKDYVAIAAVIAAKRDGALQPDNDGCYLDESNGWIDSIAEELCSTFINDNPRFDRARFLAACGVQS